MIQRAVALFLISFLGLRMKINQFWRMFSFLDLKMNRKLPKRFQNNYLKRTIWFWKAKHFLIKLATIRAELPARTPALQLAVEGYIKRWGHNNVKSWSQSDVLLFMSLFFNFSNKIYPKLYPIPELISRAKVLFPITFCGLQMRINEF